MKNLLVALAIALAAAASFLLGRHLRLRGGRTSDRMFVFAVLRQIKAGGRSYWNDLFGPRVESLGQIEAVPTEIAA